jgi:hypothetical protein
VLSIFSAFSPFTGGIAGGIAGLATVTRAVGSFVAGDMAGGMTTYK